MFLVNRWETLFVFYNLFEKWFSYKNIVFYLNCFNLVFVNLKKLEVRGNSYFRRDRRGDCDLGIRGIEILSVGKI